MAVLPQSVLWQRLDGPGAEQVVFEDRRGLTARGLALGADPVPYACRYELTTDEKWVTTRFDVTVEGAGWLRNVRLERTADRWRVTTAEQGDLDRALRSIGRPAEQLPGIEDPHRLHAALDVDLWASPLTNTLPIRRLGLRNAPPGTSREITVAWVLLPSLAVVPGKQEYLATEGGVRFSSDTFTADLTLDEGGFLVHYPGLAQRA